MLRSSFRFLPVTFSLAFLCGELLAGGPSHQPFFAMNTIARGGPGEVVPMLKDLGYDGLGGSAGDDVMATELEKAGLRFFNGYITMEFRADASVLDERLRGILDRMKDHDCALWVAISKVAGRDGAFAHSSADGDGVVVPQLVELATYAESRGVKVALYPHAGSWLERVEDAIRVADKINRSSVGVTFNLCHWLRVEGSDRDPSSVLKRALPRLMFVTINGADTGDTTHMGWDRLIQPLDRGSYDVGGFLRKVRAAGYAGPIGFQGFGIKEEPRDVLARTMTAWKKLDAEAR